MAMVFLRRLARAAITILLLMTFAFIVLRTSGSGASAMLGAEADPAAIAAFNTRWGLEKPLFEQYITFITALLHGDFGQSFIGRRPALEAVLERVPATLSLMGSGLLVAVFLGLALGVFTAHRRGTAVDRVTTFVALAGYCVPSFIIAIFLILALSVEFGWLPTTGNNTALHYILPITTVAVGEFAVFVRFARTSMLEIMNQPYMRAALAKGLSPSATVWRHALPNMAVPMVTLIGLAIGSLFVGATITENVFAWPGMGQLLVQAVTMRDAAVVQTIMVLVGISMVTVNITVDLLYAWLDPRIGPLE
ncbi:ABC transporter permease [Bradyrhizobium diazoefficiens]|uniref:ABC transporter permease n=1 Tax=Bradyrhizobium diazoefficiens TaxID=1355477 RepID=UPI00190B18DA|nr:ABC transporter permease [Bradyrhizobium diazoefficiens]MBK3666442.1 ABC transporter permease [Bradyrhizobium diazoefficiens]